MTIDVIYNNKFKCIIVVKLESKNQHLFEVALVISSRLITPHVFQLLLISYQMYVNDRSMTYFGDECFDFFND